MLRFLFKYGIYIIVLVSVVLIQQMVENADISKLKENLYKLSSCGIIIIFLIRVTFQKEYVLAIFIPIFGIAIIYYLKEIIKELRHKK